ncbi:MAG: hypothetical protein AAF196_11985, partial [Planctomycetota bacterium]
GSFFPRTGLRRSPLAERVFAACWVSSLSCRGLPPVHLLGDGDPHKVPPMHDVPVLLVTWQAAVAHRWRDEDPDRAKALFEEAVNVLRRVDVPLPLRIAILRESGRERHAERLIASVRGRFQDAQQARRFSSFASQIRLDPFEI